MNALPRVLLVALAVAVGTVVLDWWAVPIVGLVWGLVAPPNTRPVTTAGLGAALGWLVLLGWMGLHGPIVALAGKTGAVLGIGGWGLLGAAVLYPTLLGAAAAGLGAAARARR